jgi:hypothetical protein
VRKRAATDGRIEGSTLAEKRRWQQHKKEENRQQNAAERKEEKNEKFAVPDMGLEPMTSRLRVCHSAN